MPETKTTRISKWVYDFFASKAAKEDTTLLKKLDELTEVLQLLDVEEVVLNSLLNNAYKEDDTNTPRYVFEVLSALMNYYNKLSVDGFHQYNFKQFIDRWNVVAYYINSHVYTNVLSKSALRDDELRQRAESAMGMVFLFDRDVEVAIKYCNEVIKSIDPYENSYICKKTKALIMTKIFEHKELMGMLESELMVRKEGALSKLYNQLSDKYILTTDGKTPFSVSVQSNGISNKIAHLMYIHYKEGMIEELPYYVDEKFLSDIFSLYHNYSLSYHDSDLFDARGLESAFTIAQAVKGINKYSFEDSYLKGNLENGNKFNELDKALAADIDSLKGRQYTYNAEMRLRTPMHIIVETTKSDTRYIHRPDIKKVILKHLINICYPIYHSIVKKEGEILHFRDDLEGRSKYSEDKSAEIAVSLKEKAYYVNLILYISEENNNVVSTNTLYMKHDSIEKIYHCLKMEGHNTIKIENNLSFSYNSSDYIKIYYEQGSLFLYGRVKKAFINVIVQYVESETFLEFKRLDTLNRGLI